MKNWITSRAPLCVAALLLCAIAQAQWPARWNTSGTADDEGQCVAVDHRGNVFVAGKTKHWTGSNWDIQVLKYDAAGTLQWEKHYDGGSGDDIPTSISVDWEGNCYVAGVSYGGSPIFPATGTDYDFVVVKYDKDGFTVWPSSGTRTGYKFDNGALRLTDTNKDGWDPIEGQYLCAMAMRDGAGAQPTFAIAGPTTAILSQTQWRTIVFETDATDGVKIKTGWPLEDLGDVNDDIPHGVAIHTDDTVYVVGGHHYGEELEEFTTIRYRASGTSGAGSSRIWKDTWHDISGKPSQGRAIALDYDGNAFVTGVLLAGAGTKAYGTRKILKDPDGSGDPIHGWETDPIYDEDNDDIPTSISLSFENESGYLRTYVHVTGTSQDGLIAGRIPHKIATVRYRGTDGNEMWVDRTVDTGDASARPYIVAMGKGNSYVIGRKYTSGNYDYLLRALTKTGATRFTDVTYDGPAGGRDEGLWGVMAGAGNVIFTGKSPGSGTANDFLTGQHIETDDPGLIWGMTVNGVEPEFPYTDLDAVDSDYVTGSSVDGEVAYEFTFSGAIEPTEYSIVLDGHVSTTGLREKVEIYNGAWQLISDQPATTSDAPTVIPIKKDPQVYSVGHLDLVYVRVTYYGSNSAWTAYLNRARLDQIQ